MAQQQGRRHNQPAKGEQVGGPSAEKRRNRWWHAAVVLVVLVAVYVIGSGFVVRSVLEKLLFAGQLNFATQTDNPYQLGYRGDPQQAFGFAFEAVHYHSELGPVPAWFVPPPVAGAPDLAALYVHGIAGQREDGYRQLSVLREAGIPVLLINYRNDDNAPPAPDKIYSFGLTEWRDLAAAATYMRGRGYKRLILVADSMGGAIAAAFLQNLALQDRVPPYTIAALVLDAPALNFAMVLRYQIGKLYLPLSPLIEPVALALFARRYGTDLRLADYMQVIAQFDGPLFIAHGRDDQIVPVAVSEQLLRLRLSLSLRLQQRRQPSQAVITQGDHLQSWHQEPQRYRQVLSVFLQQLIADNSQ